MMIAAFSDPTAFEGVEGEVEAVMEEMGEYLTDAPHGHSGTVFLSYRPGED